MLIEPVTSFTIRAAIRRLNLSNRPVCVHSSLRSFGCVEGGAETVVAAFLAEGCTFMVPTFTSGFEVSPPSGRRYPRNACDYLTESWPGDDRSDHYSTDMTAVDADMGVIPTVVAATPQRERGNHPSDSFSALGPVATELIRGQQPMRVYAPLEELARREGSVVLMGVDMTRMTLLHLAEQRAGRSLFRRWARDDSGDTIEMEQGGCSSGFEQLRPALRSIERDDLVGSSQWRVYPAAPVLDVASKIIRDHPRITHCPDVACIRCRDMTSGGPIIDRSEDQLQ
jgi:aminoglycoside 3-N-acetyltransferase